MGNKLIQAPMPDGTSIAVSGRVVFLQLGSRKRYKCFIQDEPQYLLDYRTGMRFPSVHGHTETLNAEKVYFLATAGSHARPMTDREAAQLRLHRLVDNVGEAKIFAAIDAAPTLNED